MKQVLFANILGILIQNLLNFENLAREILQIRRFLNMAPKVSLENVDMNKSRHFHISVEQ